MVRCSLYQMLINESYNDDEADNCGCIYVEATGEGYPTVTPQMISTAGGHQLTLGGTFPEATAVQVFMGPAGDETDTPCYSGELGNAYAPVSEDGETLYIVSPPIAKGTQKITVRYDSENHTDWSVLVVERNWPGKLHRTRRSFAPWKALGARMLDGEEAE
jgi:hypothetical protein